MRLQKYVQIIHVVQMSFNVIMEDVLIMHVMVIQSVLMGPMKHLNYVKRSKSKNKQIFHYKRRHKKCISKTCNELLTVTLLLGDRNKCPPNVVHFVNTYYKESNSTFSHYRRLEGSALN